MTLRDRLANRPRIALILGSGLAPMESLVTVESRIAYADLDGFPAAGVSGHAGEVISGTLAGVPVCLLSGRAHFYETGNAAAMRPALEALRDAGIDTVIQTNAAGAVNPAMEPGDVMLIEDHINLAGANPLTGTLSDRRFVDMTNAYDPALGARLLDAAEALGIALHAGVYAWFAGPSFETPAEIRMARRLGADAVGMSTVPETILCRYLGLRVVAASVITNLGAGLGDTPLSHAQTQQAAPIGGTKLAAILQKAVPEM